jgi:hypothetical protein
MEGAIVFLLNKIYDINMYKKSSSSIGKLFWLISIIISLLILLSFGCGGGGGSSTSYSATLTWDPPTTNADGTPLIELAGYKIYYGTLTRNYTKVINVGNITTYTIKNLTPDTYYFAVTAYDNSGNESGYSNEVSKTIH